MADPAILNGISEDAKQWGFKALDLQNQLAQLQFQKQHMDLMKNEVSMKAADMTAGDLQRVYTSPTPKMKKLNIQRAVQNANSAGHPLSQEMISMLDDSDWDQPINQSLQQYLGAGKDPAAARALLQIVQSNQAAQIIQTYMQQRIQGDTLKDIYGTAGGKQIVENTQSAIKKASAAGDADSMQLLNQGLQNPSAAMQIPGFNEALTKYGMSGLAQQAGEEQAGALTKASSLPELVAAKEAPLSLVHGAPDLYQKIAADPLGSSAEDRAKLARMANDAKTLQEQLKQRNDTFKTGYDAQKDLAKDARQLNKDYREGRSILDRTKSTLQLIKNNPNNNKLVTSQIDRLLSQVADGRVSVFRNVDAGVAESGGGIYDKIENTIQGWRGKGVLQPGQVQQVEQWVNDLARVQASGYRQPFQGIMVQAKDAASRPQLKEGFNDSVIAAQIPEEFRGSARPAAKPKQGLGISGSPKRSKVTPSQASTNFNLNAAVNATKGDQSKIQATIQYLQQKYPSLVNQYKLLVGAGK